MNNSDIDTDKTNIVNAAMMNMLDCGVYCFAFRMQKSMCECRIDTMHILIPVFCEIVQFSDWRAHRIPCSEAQTAVFMSFSYLQYCCRPSDHIRFPIDVFVHAHGLILIQTMNIHTHM